MTYTDHHLAVAVAAHEQTCRDNIAAAIDNLKDAIANEQDRAADVWRRAIASTQVQLDMIRSLRQYATELAENEAS